MLPIVFITLVALLVCLSLGFLMRKRIGSREYILLPGEPSLPLNIPIPEHLDPNFLNYITHEDTDWGAICPPEKEGMECRSSDDCGVAQVCVPDIRKYCQCFIANACIYDAVC